MPFRVGGGYRIAQVLARRRVLVNASVTRLRGESRRFVDVEDGNGHLQGVAGIPVGNFYRYQVDVVSVRICRSLVVGRRPEL